MGFSLISALSALLTWILLTWWFGDMPRQIAQRHCEQSGYALGKYEDQQIVCYQKVSEP